MNSNCSVRTIESTVYRLLLEVVPWQYSAKSLAPELSLQNDLGIDSLGKISFAFRVEEELGLDFSEHVSRIGEIQTVGDVICFINSLLEQRAKADPVGYFPGISVRPHSGYLPLSCQQFGYLDMMPQGAFAPGYSAAAQLEHCINMSKAVLIHNVLDLAAMERSFTEVIRRHESLRTRFRIDNNKIMQEVASPEKVQLEIANLSDSPDSSQDAEIVRLSTEVFLRPFKHDTEQLLRGLVLTLSDREHRLIVVVSHAVTDMPSVQIIVQEIAAFYVAFSQNEPLTLPEPEVQYGDYVMWQREWLQGEGRNRMIEYCRTHLNETCLLELPTDHPRPSYSIVRGERSTFWLSPNLCISLLDLSSVEQIPLFVILLSVFEALLYRWTGQENIVVASMFAGRVHPQTLNTVGHFSYRAPQRALFSGNLSFRDLFSQVKQNYLAAQSIEDVLPALWDPEMAGELGWSRRYPVGINLVSVGNSETVHQHSEFRRAGLEIAQNELDLSSIPVFTEFQELMLLWLFNDTTKEIGATVHHAVGLFDASTIDHFISDLQMLLEAIVADPGCRVSEVPISLRTIAKG